MPPPLILAMPRKCRVFEELEALQLLKCSILLPMNKTEERAGNEYSERSSGPTADPGPFRAFRRGNAAGGAGSQSSFHPERRSSSERCRISGVSGRVSARRSDGKGCGRPSGSGEWQLSSEFF